MDAYSEKYEPQKLLVLLGQSCLGLGDQGQKLHKIFSFEPWLLIKWLLIKKKVYPGIKSQEFETH